VSSITKSDELADVLVRARELLARQQNDFAWSSWKDQSAALDEMDGLLAKVRRGQVPRLTLNVLFAPTGPIQEVSISSGWADEFLAIAREYDGAAARASRRWWKFW